MDNYVNINSESMDLGLLSSYRMLLFLFLEDVGKLPNHRKLNFAVLNPALANSTWRSALICHTKELQADLCICCPSPLDFSIFVCNS